MHTSDDVPIILNPLLSLSSLGGPKDSEDYKGDGGVHKHECMDWYSGLLDQCTVEANFLEE